MPYADQRLPDTIASWDDLKAALGLRKATIAKLHASDPHTNDGTIIWNDHGITTADARRLWLTLPHEETTDDATTDDADRPMDREPDTKR